MQNLVLAGATPANVATQATNPAAIDPSALNLLGVFGPSDNLRALVRMPGGRVQQVSPGQRLAWGRIVGIDATGLVVQKNGRTSQITMPGNA